MIATSSNPVTAWVRGRAGGWRLLLGAFVTVVALVQPCEAQEETQAMRRFNHGIELAGKKRYAEAVEIWHDVLDELDEAYLPQAHKAMGLAYMKMGRLPQARHHLGLYLGIPRTEDAAAARWLEEVDRGLESEYVKVRLKCVGGITKVQPEFGRSANDPNADEASYGCPLTWWFKPGEHRLAVRLPKGERRAYYIKVGETPATQEFVLRAPPQKVVTQPKAETASASKLTSWLSVALATPVTYLFGIMVEAYRHRSRNFQWSAVNLYSSGAGGGGALIGIAFLGVGAKGNFGALKKNEFGFLVFPLSASWYHLFDSPDAVGLLHVKAYYRHTVPAEKPRTTTGFHFELGLVQPIIWFNPDDGLYQGQALPLLYLGFGI
jgi:hypothetical protein